MKTFFQDSQCSSFELKGVSIYIGYTKNGRNYGFQLEHFITLRILALKIFFMDSATIIYLKYQKESYHLLDLDHLV